MRILGLDCGIASVGWGLIDVENSSGDKSPKGEIVAAGTWMFDAPEEKSQTGTKLKSEIRRTFRGQRRVIRRRRMRMNEVRRLLKKYGLLPSDHSDALKLAGLDPWKIRAEGLERLLSPSEFAVALGHIARHRGFKSNSKGTTTTDEAKDDSKMKKAAAETREKLARYNTPAKLLVDDQSFIVRKTLMKNGSFDIVRRYRNREGDYSRSLMRDDLAAEVRALFRNQQRFQSSYATKLFEDEYSSIAFYQRPLQDSWHLVGYCPFEKEEKRSPKRGYSFELFRFLSRLNNLTLVVDRNERRLSKDELRIAVSDFGVTAKVTYSALRKKLKLSEDIVFMGLKLEDEKKLDVVARSGETAAGTARLRRIITETLGETAWGNLVISPHKLDKIAETISFRNDLSAIKKGLVECGCDDDLATILATASGEGKLDVFTGAGHLSSKAARNILPGLQEGLTYDKACLRAGYDYSVSREQHAFNVGVHGKEALKKILSEKRISPELIGSPTARKALIEAVKQVKAIIEKYGVPDRVHIELSRDIGKSIEERREITFGIEKRNKQKEKLKEAFVEEIGRLPQDGERGAEELLRFELWKEQNGFCLYTETYLNPKDLFSGKNIAQIDHILPWHRFGDDSFTNKTLCSTKANQEKKGRTPYEWFKADKTENEWFSFIARVDAIKSMKGFKKRNYKLKNSEEIAEKFRNRNLNDTRWTCRLLAEVLKQLYPKGEKDETGVEKRRIYARPGGLINRLRRAWGLQWIKKDEKGVRIPDDRHHALDAIIVAATTESLLQRATREVQEIERKGLPYDLTKSISSPWPKFREETIACVENIFVSRAERRRARGKAHEATIRQISIRDGQQGVYERKSVADLKLSDLDNVKDADRNAAIIKSLRIWIDAGKPKDSPPVSPKGDPVTKIRLLTKNKVNIPFNTGNPDRLVTVDRGEMARVDVFRKANRNGKYEYYLVPIYPHEIATLKSPPLKAVTSGKPEIEWPSVDHNFEFMWSLVSMNFLQAVTTKGEILEGYYRGMDRSTGSISISHHYNSMQVTRSIGARTLTKFTKFNVDRLGSLSEICRELRTWHGKVCT